MLDLDRISSSRRPQGAPAGYHTWSDLLFIHWRVPPTLLQPLLPRELTVDTYADAGWVGIVLFRMSEVRPWWSPPVWGLSSFPETNVRTYVHVNGKDPGVWFFSLDAANWLAVQLARSGWGLNYQWAKMTVQRDQSRLIYRSQRRRGVAVCDAEIEIDAPFTQGLKYGDTHIAKPGTLEHFLVERYLMYAQRNGTLYQAQVHHRPYPLDTVRLNHFNQQLLAANRIEVHEPPCHLLFSSTVSVEVFPLRPLERIARPTAPPAEWPPECRFPNSSSINKTSNTKTEV